MHATLLRDLLRDTPEDPRGVTAAWDVVTETCMAPWHRATCAVDRARLIEIDALQQGLQPLTSSPAAPGAALAEAARYDPDLFRAFMEVSSCLTLPTEVLARPGLADTAREVAAAHPPPAAPGPDRGQLLGLLAG